MRYFRWLFSLFFVGSVFAQPTIEQKTPAQIQATTLILSNSGAAANHHNFKLFVDTSGYLNFVPLDDNLNSSGNDFVQLQRVTGSTNGQKLNGLVYQDSTATSCSPNYGQAILNTTDLISFGSIASTCTSASGLLAKDPSTAAHGSQPQMELFGTSSVQSGALTLGFRIICYLNGGKATADFVGGPSGTGNNYCGFGAALPGGSGTDVGAPISGGAAGTENLRWDEDNGHFYMRAGNGFKGIPVTYEDAEVSSSSVSSAQAVALTVGDASQAGSTLVLQCGSNNGCITLSGVSTGTNADFLCLSAGGVILLQSSACTISTQKFKENLAPLLDASSIMDLKVEHYLLNEPGPVNKDPNFYHEQVGLVAENVAQVLPDCTIYENDMKTPKSYRPECITAYLVKIAQDHQRELVRDKIEIYLLAIWCLIMTFGHGYHYSRGKNA
jgi:hypothetical protein